MVPSEDDSNYYAVAVFINGYKVGEFFPQAEVPLSEDGRVTIGLFYGDMEFVVTVPEV